MVNKKWLMVNRKTCYKMLLKVGGMYSLAI